MSLTHILEHNVPHKPALFNTEMVKATLEGRKTQTRRVLKTQPDDEAYYLLELNDDILTIDYNQGDENPTLQCPYGKPGDLLWVREKSRIVSWDPEWETDGFLIEYADGQRRDNVELFQDDDKTTEFLLKVCDKLHARCEPRIDEEEETFSWTAEQINTHMPWTPSIHMPKAAARIWLRIKSIHVERLLDISENDARKEGVERIRSEAHPTLPIFKNYNFKKGAAGWEGHAYLPFAKASFYTLWRSCYGPDSWRANHWVWVIEFEVLSTDGAPSLLLLHSLNLIPAE